MNLRFEWDRSKAKSNIKKHGVGFEEAGSGSVFTNPLARIFDDEGHSISEQREIIIGHSLKNRLLVVCFTEYAKNVIRVISARLATKKEQRDYEENTNF